VLGGQLGPPQQGLKGGWLGPHIWVLEGYPSPPKGDLRGGARPPISALARAG